MVGVRWAAADRANDNSRVIKYSFFIIAVIF